MNLEIILSFFFQINSSNCIVLKFNLIFNTKLIVEDMIDFEIFVLLLVLEVIASCKIEFSISI